jgi:hypothetical protein
MTGQHHEPEHHDRSEEPPDPVGAETLRREQQREDDDADRQHGLGQVRLRHLKALDGGQHGDRGRDERVAVEQRRAEHTEGQRERRAAGRRACHPAHERGKGHDSAFAVVVGAQDEGHVLDRHHTVIDQKISDTTP